MPIYLHELVDVVPGRAEDYCDSMAEHHGTAATKRGQRESMLGLWTAIDVAGTWPLAVNVWQYGTWRDVETQLARQFEPKTQDPALKQWWLSNLHLRTGGFDRLIESTDYTLDVGGLRQKGIAGAFFLHQIVTLVPGAAETYLEAFGREGVGAVEGAGGQLVGAYRVRMRRNEAVTIFAFAGPSELAAYQRAWYDGSSALGRWRAREPQWVRDRESLILKARYFLRSPWHS